MGTILLIVVIILLLGGGGGYYGYRQLWRIRSGRCSGFGVDHSFGALVLRWPPFPRSMIRAWARFVGRVIPNLVSTHPARRLV